MSQHVIPRNLNLGAIKPTTIPAYSRRVESIATNAQQFNENQIANIVLDTSTPGSFLDPSQSLIQFDIEISNSNPYIDYINLSSCGLGAVIQEMRIICQGTPVEEMLDYNMMFEMFMDLGGAAQDEFKMYMENSWRAPVPPGYSDLNFVKPPMVDRSGVIMCPNAVNIFGDSNLGTIHNEDGNQLLDNTTGISGAYTNQPDRAKGQNYIAGGAGTLGGYNYTSSYTTQRGPTSQITPANATKIVTATGTANAADSNMGGNYAHLWEPTAARWTGSTAAGNIRTQTWTNRIDNTYVTWPSTIRPEPLIKNEARIRQEGEVKKYRIQDYIQYLANVKNIPVGIAPTAQFTYDGNGLARPSVPTATFTSQIDNGETKISNWNFASIASNNSIINSHMTGTTKFQYTVTLPIFSGLLGVWAEKQFPTMLISPGSFYIQMKFAKASHAFQCAMDPCRRILGTYRDYVPNCGLANFYATEFRGQNLDATKQGLIPACDGTNNTFMALTTAATTGNDFAWNGILGLYASTTGLSGAAYVAVNNTTNNYYRNNLIANATSGGAVSTGGTGATVPANMIDLVGQGEGYSTGNAKPQYVPRKTPWNMAGNGFSEMCVNVGSTNALAAGTKYVREREVCFGTHLPFSTAQVRRTRRQYNNSLGGAASGSLAAINSDDVPKYTISNLKYVGMQTILPDEVTASIVRAAASSDISLHSQSVRSYRSVLNNSDTQNIILPIKVASANSMWVTFQHQNMIENSHYLGMTRICPFSNFKWTVDTNLFVGSNVAPVMSRIGTQVPFKIQLRIGNELVPQQPIETINHVITELQRSVHGLSDMDCNLPFYASVRSMIFDNIAGSSAATGGSQFLCLGHEDFCNPYIPIEALDDQTITNNSAFLDYHQAWGSTYSWSNFNDRGIYVLNEHVPPVSKFILGFDLDTFPGTNDTARSGRYLGNAPLTLQMTNCKAANSQSLSTDSTSNVIISTAFVLHDIRFSIMAGGQVLAYY